MKRRRQSDLIPEKAGKILNGILVLVLIILLRVWYVAIVQHDEKLSEAERPQRRVVIEEAPRATITDRFGRLLATNQVQYNATVSYAGIRELPRFVWREDELGNRIKCPYRKEYIEKLAHLLARELHLDPERIEDLIHGKAAILGNVLCVIQENISEEAYFRLKMLEKDWPGICAEIGAKRTYPSGRVGGEVVGYLGAISRNQYESITQELHALREYVASCEEGNLPSILSIEEMKERLEALEKRAYTLNDQVGKSGVEATFDEELRGLRGKRVYLADTKGNFLRELPGSEEPVPGVAQTLSLSTELQEYAESLLAAYAHEPSSLGPAETKRREKIPPHQPWIKSGAIVALDPKTGEVLALASYPRFDPNDFIDKSETQINRWLETESYIGGIWDFKYPYLKEQYPLGSEEEGLLLTWGAYLDFILPKSSLVRKTLEEHGRICDAILAQRKCEQLIAFFESESHPLSPTQVFDLLYTENPVGGMITLQERAFFKERFEKVAAQVERVQKELAPYFCHLSHNYDKLLLIDLYRIVVDARKFSPRLTSKLGSLTLSEYREASAYQVAVDETLRALAEELFHNHDFKQWREQHFKEHLAERREEEKALRRKYARPYLDYLDLAEKKQFEAFWEEHHWNMLALFLTGEGDAPYWNTFKSWAEEIEAGAHRGLAWVDSYRKLNPFLKSLDREQTLYPFLKSVRPFQALDRPLLGRYRGLRGKRESALAAAFYPTYGFGFARSHAFRQATTIGSIFKLVPAYEAIRQQFEKKGELNPLVMIDDKHRTWGSQEGWNVGYTVERRAIPMYYKGGRLPRSEHAGIGRVDLKLALEVSSNPYFALLAGDILEDPEDLVAASKAFGFGQKTGIDLPGEYRGYLPIDLAYNRTGLYATAIGQHTLVGTPLQTAGLLAALANGGKVLKPQIRLDQKPQQRQRVFLPKEIQEELLMGLKQVVQGEKGTARSLKGQFDAGLVKRVIGKTSTAEIVERYGLDREVGTLKSKAIWFGSIAYESDDFSEPELVVVVYLKEGDWGKNAAPLALRVIEKWEEIKKSYSVWH